MVYLLFQIGADRYALEASGTVAVEPCVRLKHIPGAAAGVAGVFDYHGTPVPVVDLSAMALGRPARASLSTRLVIVRYGGEQLLGLLAEKAVDTARYRDADFHDPGVTGAPYLGPVATDARGGIVQRVELERLLTPEVRAVLWRQAREVLA
ncbi:MAG: chemotaxis protein CheW [Chthoniobacteraceae bacterium]|nr:chemotaxis protein CheW [Chthoniobacteraceae bacterium]